MRTSLSAYWRTLRRFDRNTRLFLLTPAVIGLSFYGFFVVLFNLYLLRLGYGPRFIGGVNASGQLAFIALSLPASALGRRWGSRKPLLLAFALYLLGFGLLPLAEFVPADWRSLWVIATFLLAFFGGPFYWVNGSVYLMGATEPGLRNHAFSIRTALLPLVGFVGALVGGWMPGWIAELRGVSLDAVGPYRDALLVAALLYLPGFLALLAADDIEGERRPASAGERRPPGQRPPYALIVPLVVVEALRMAGEVGTYGFFNLYLDDALGVATSGIGALVGVALLLSGLLALTTPLLTARIGQRSAIAVAMLGMAAALLLMALVPTWWGAAIGYTGAFALAAMGNAALSLYRMERVGAAWWSLIAGMAVTGQGVGEAGVLFVGGFVIAGAGFRSYFLMVAGLVAAAALFFWIYFRRFEGATRGDAAPTAAVAAPPGGEGVVTAPPLGEGEEH